MSRPVALAIGALLVAGALFRVAVPGGPTDRIDADVAIEGGLIRELAADVEENLPRSDKLELVVPAIPGEYGTPAIDLFLELQMAGYDVQVDMPGFDGREVFGRGNVSDRDPQRRRVAVTSRDVADPAAIIGGVAPLTADEQAELADLRSRLTRQIEDGNLEWTLPGAVMAYRQDPDVEYLLTGSRLLRSLQSGTLTGDLPSIDDALRYGELQVRTERPGSLVLVDVTTPT